MPSHLPVMLEAVVEALAPRRGATLIDGTLGLGGHAEALLEAIGPEGRLIGIERDGSLLAVARERLARFGPAFRGVHTRLSFLREVVRGAGAAPVDGILLDLGVCSAQLDDPKRGFSFREDAREVPLDMRMDTSRGESAAELLARIDEDELAALLRDGGVAAPRRAARALRARQPLLTVGDLLDALRGFVLPRRGHHPATLVFQALRMAVNDKSRELQAALDASVDLLAPGGRLAVLSYHSGEHRLVKACFASEQRGCICPPDLPVCGCGRTPRLRPVVRSRGADAAEIARNPRARSARLRATERL